MFERLRNSPTFHNNFVFGILCRIYSWPCVECTDVDIAELREEFIICWAFMNDARSSFQKVYLVLVTVPSR